jgi:hypothetical protein
MRASLEYSCLGQQGQKGCFCLFRVTALHVALQNDVATLLKPISEKIQEIQTFRERNRGSNMFNHLSAVSESIPALGWIAVVSRDTALPSSSSFICLEYLGKLMVTFTLLHPQSDTLEEESFQAECICFFLPCLKSSAFYSKM